MLVAHRRRTLLTFCQAGLQVAWFTPFVLLFIPATWGRSPVAPYLALFGLLLLWLLLLDGLNRLHIRSPHYELSVIGLMVISILVSDRILLYPGRSALDLSWMSSTAVTLFNLTSGAGQLVVLILANVFLWQRAASFTSNETTFFGAGLSFRLGLLLLILGSALIGALAQTDTTPLLWIFFGLGLSSVALARIEDKQAGAHSVGDVLPISRLVQLLLAVAVSIGLAAAAAIIYSRQGIIAAGMWLSPVWRIVGWLLEIIFIVIWWLLTPVFLGLEWLLRRLAESNALKGLADLADALNNQQRLLQATSPGQSFHVPAWFWASLRYTAIALGLLLLVGFVLLYLERVMAGRPRVEPEDASAESISLGSGLLDSALGRLRDLAGLARRYGVSRQLLAAISVQNIYANVSRVARLRGYPRRPAQPPDDYLPVLRQAFAGQDEALAHITSAYMCVHYGDRPVSLEELNGLRADYRRIRRAGRTNQGA